LKNRLPLTIFWSEIVSVIQRGALKTNCIYNWVVFACLVGYGLGNNDWTF
jgi:hypothetical protein